MEAINPIISKITYPVLSSDVAYDLYKRVLDLGPHFILTSLKLFVFSSK